MIQTFEPHPIIPEEMSEQRLVLMINGEEIGATTSIELSNKMVSNLEYYMYRQGRYYFRNHLYKLSFEGSNVPETMKKYNFKFERGKSYQFSWDR